MDHQASIEYFTKYLSPPNPIIKKKVQEEQSKLIFNNLPQIHTQVINQSPKYLQEPQQSSSQSQIEEGKITLNNYYSSKTLIYRKIDNTDYSTRYRKKYYASIFANPTNLPQIQPYIMGQSQLKFNSSHESMNLFAVHKIGPKQYDLILMNDTNSRGYTQWYYFSVISKSKNVTIKFNIVNLYKNRSLYEHGMKPLISIGKKNGHRQWQRAGTNIKYYQNQIRNEYGKKYYKTLSFEHTFLSENTQTFFAHIYPHTIKDLKQKIQVWQNHPRVKLRNIGLTGMKKNIPMLQISKQQNLENKRAIIIMARQHPGQTVGSHICEEIINGILKTNQQNQFLLWKFNFYFIPIVNIDGVYLGNYRSNAYGFDLNRCWDRENTNKLPQIYAIKKQIKKIIKKCPIELFLDLHGHSRKMGSFFYGNPFGKNCGILPYIASKNNPNVSFEDSTFNKEVSDKLTTARVVLGNIFKQTGSFYTYQTSFYGGINNGRKNHFNQDSYKQLGINLLSSIFKTFIQLHKQQKTLKESIFLKDIRKQVKAYKKLQNQMQCSDSDAAETTLKQFKTMQKIQKAQIKKQIKYIKKQKKESVSVEIQVDSQISRVSKVLLENKVLKKTHSKDIKQFYNNIDRSADNYALHVGFKRNSQEIQKQQFAGSPVARKKYLLKKLRVFGETFIEPNPRDKNKQTQTDSQGLQILGNRRKKNQFQFPCKINQYRKKNRNKSLIIKLDNKQKIGMADIVKVNKLEYRKIRRDSKLDLSILKKQSKGSSHLPSLN